MNIFATKTDSLPGYTDLDGDAVSFSLTNPMATFVSLVESNNLKLNPTKCNEVGTNTFQVLMTDSISTPVTTTITVTVLDTPPIYDNGPVTYATMTVALN